MVVAGAFVALLSLGPMELGVEVGAAERCRATVFAYAGDRLAGGVAPALGRRVRPTDWLVAHRRLPKRSLALVCRGTSCALAPVMDRGPYMMRMPDGTRVNGAHLPKEQRVGEWTGCVDLTPPVAEAIGLPGSGHQRAGRVTVQPARLRWRWRPAPGPEV